MIDLVVFDLDGTLAKIYTIELMPGVAEFFRLLYQGNCQSRPKVAVATNQGGVGMRYWMEQKRFGKPESYPTAESIDERLRGLAEKLGAPADLPMYASYRYQNRQGEWAPIPIGEEDNPRWSQEWRKPLPGMLQQAMQDAGVSPEQTLFVGDSEDDLNAARAAGCAFTWARDFFVRRWQDCDALDQLNTPDGTERG